MTAPGNTPGGMGGFPPGMGGMPGPGSGYPPGMGGFPGMGPSGAYPVIPGLGDPSGSIPGMGSTWGGPNDDLDILGSDDPTNEKPPTDIPPPEEIKPVTQGSRLKRVRRWFLRKLLRKALVGVIIIALYLGTVVNFATQANGFSFISNTFHPLRSIGTVWHYNFSADDLMAEKVSAGTLPQVKPPTDTPNAQIMHPGYMAMIPTGIPPAPMVGRPNLRAQLNAKPRTLRLGRDANAISLGNRDWRCTYLELPASAGGIRSITDYLPTDLLVMYDPAPGHKGSRACLADESNHQTAQPRIVLWVTNSPSAPATAPSSQPSTKSSGSPRPSRSPSASPR